MLQFHEYKFGFNGMEKDDEVKGNGNSLDFGARIYDPRIGRWFSTDPLEKEYPDISPFVFTANNPVLFIDIDGERFVLGGLTAKAVDDVKSLVPEKYASLISVTDKNEVQIDLSSLTKEEIQSDAGLSLIKDLVASDNDYLYEVSEDFTRVVHDGSTKTTPSSSFPDHVMTKEPKHEWSSNDSKAGPKDGYDAQVTIHPNLELFQTVEGKIQKTGRPALIFHALQEAYEIQDNGLKYIYSDPSKVGAHQTASEKEARFHQPSETPGEYSGWRATDSDGTVTTKGRTNEDD